MRKAGACQHVDCIGTRAEVFSFSKNTEAPLMGTQQQIADTP